MPSRNAASWRISASFGPLTALRRRWTVGDSSLVIAPDENDSTLTVEGRARKHCTVRFASTGFTSTESGRLSIPGELSVRDETFPITLDTRVVGQGNNRLRIGTGRVNRIRLLLAADFR